MNDIEFYDEYHKSDFFKIRNSIMIMIEEKFNEYDFIKTFKRLSLENNVEQFKDYVKERLTDVSELEKYTLNEMYKMLNEINCRWEMYEIGEIIHKALIELWYPENLVEGEIENE